MPSKENDLMAKARASALASLAMREHSVLELRQKLVRKGMPDGIVVALLDDLQKQNLLSNERFAEVYWRQRASKGFGPTKITYELQQKGIDDDLIGQAQLDSEVDFYEVIEQVYSKKYAGKSYDNLPEKAKRQGFLYRRGFPVDMIKSVLS